MIEAFTAITSAIVAWHFGYTPQTVFALVLTWSLITLSCIDIDYQLLPDNITLPVLWLGLFLSLFGFFTDTHDGIIGAITGYTILSIICLNWQLARRAWVMVILNCWLYSAPGWAGNTYPLLFYYHHWSA
jgi:leader peptidase (prepilin peptidase)/N-methyltransferase